MPLGFLGPIGMPELVIILVVGLMLFGGRLPDVARSLGRSVHQFKRGLRDLKGEFDKAETDDPPASLPSRRPAAVGPGSAGPTAPPPPDPSAAAPPPGGEGGYSPKS
jgi:sec-independent protein translocase protein TatA